jgi:hypothetical protein
MKRLILNGLMFLSLLIFSSACKKNITLDFHKIDNTKVLVLSRPNDSIKNYCKIDIQLLYPTDGDNPEILKKIQQQLLTFAFDSTYADYTPKQAVETFSKVTFEAYKKNIGSIKESKVNPGPRNEEWVMNTVIWFNDKSILSYELSRSSKVGKDSAGGTQFMVFNLKTGEKITERDIFEEGFEPLLSDLMKKQIMADNGFESEEQMINEGYFFAENILPNGNFVVSEDGITYVFNTNEIAVYSMGSTEVTVPFNKLKSVLKKKSPIAFLFK